MMKVDSTANSSMEFQILKGAVENTNEAFVTIDHKSTVVFFNKAAEDMFGFTRDEMIGQDLGMLLTPMCQEGHQIAVERYIETRKPTLIGHETELTVARKNGETFPASISFSVADVSGKLFFTGIIRDLTETKALQDKIIQSERLAALGQTVAEITHEIKNPLMLIGGFARRLQKKVEDEEDQAKLKIITEEVERLEKLLSELKDLYRSRQLNIEKINISTLLREVVSLSVPKVKGDGVEIIFDSDEEELFVEADKEKLKQVLLNLIKNSLEALPNGGTITVSIKDLKDKVEVLVADTGEGIPQKIQEKIFSPFFTTKDHGTGLGLCITKRIIEDHPGSSFCLESKEGDGTEVTIGLCRCRP